MVVLLVAGRVLELPGAHPAASRDSRDPRAWVGGEWLTVRLLAPLEALRVHTAGRAYPGRPASSEQGRWYALDDVIETSGELAASRSLPGAFTHTSVVRVPAGAVLNVGFASALFGGAGGGGQAEFLGGPTPSFVALRGKHWHGRAGHVGGGH
ncbi:MAG: hypothetical protein JSR54_02465 [Proteobacteria bacterium]|nr:hypothetical protein [Pseudomonadota bacterium]